MCIGNAKKKFEINHERLGVAAYLNIRSTWIDVLLFCSLCPSLGRSRDVRLFARL